MSGTPVRPSCADRACGVDESATSRSKRRPRSAWPTVAKATGPYAFLNCTPPPARNAVATTTQGERTPLVVTRAAGRAPPRREPLLSDARTGGTKSKGTRGPQPRRARDDAGRAFADAAKPQPDDRFFAADGPAGAVGPGCGRRPPARRCTSTHCRARRARHADRRGKHRRRRRREVAAAPARRARAVPRRRPPVHGVPITPGGLRTHHLWRSGAVGRRSTPEPERLRPRAARRRPGFSSIP